MSACHMTTCTLENDMYNIQVEDSSLHLVVFWEISIKQAADMGPLINVYVQNGVLVFGCTIIC